MSDWREIEAVWQEGEVFFGQNKVGHQVCMGSPEGFSPMELLLISLAGCTGMDVTSILEKKRQKLQSMRVIVRGLRREEFPRIYTEIEIEYRLVGHDLDHRAVEQAVSLSHDKYCSVSAMLGQSAELRTSFNIHEKDDVTQV